MSYSEFVLAYRNVSPAIAKVAARAKALEWSSLFGEDYPALSKLALRASPSILMQQIAKGKVVYSSNDYMR